MPTRKQLKPDQTMSRSYILVPEPQEAATVSKMETVRQEEFPVVKQGHSKPLEFEGFAKMSPNYFHYG